MVQRGRVEDNASQTSEINTGTSIIQTQKHRNIDNREKNIKNHESMNKMRPTTVGLSIDFLGKTGRTFD